MLFTASKERPGARACVPTHAPRRSPVVDTPRPLAPGDMAAPSAPSFPAVDAFFADCGAPGAAQTEAAVRAFVARHSDGAGQ